MGLRKGQPSKAYLEGKMDKYNFSNLSEEKKREIAMKGVEARKEKMKARKAMKEQLEVLLSLDVKSTKSRAALKDLGIEDEQMTNQMLLMVSLFKKGLAGDVSAIKQINDMVNSEVDDPQQLVQAPIINIVGVNPSNISTSGRVDVRGARDDDEEW